jgi:hypothetical protein
MTRKPSSAWSFLPISSRCCETGGRYTGIPGPMTSRSSACWTGPSKAFCSTSKNVLWWAEWGERPASADARAEVLRSVVSGAPKLIPLFSHRYLPETPHESGNPVFPVYQSDVIYYGADLAHYFKREFGSSDRPWPDRIKHIPFWSDLVERY